MTTIYQAIFQDNEKTFFIEYQPVEGVPGAIEILNAHVEPRIQATIFEQRKDARRGHRVHIGRGIDSDPRDDLT